MTPVGDLVRAAATRALDVAFPGECVGCGTEGSVMCRACADALDARLTLPAGVPIGLPGEIPAPLLQIEWCAPFRGVVRDALHAIKYSGEQRIAGPLGAAIARRWSRVGVGAEIVTHVPVHSDRRRVRGYDQAELIARSAAKQLGLPHVPLLERRRATIAQFDLDRRDRASNVAGAFLVRDPAGPTDPADPSGASANAQTIEGRWILLIDDVLTTGATLAASADALYAAGAIGVSAVTVARER